MLKHALLQPCTFGGQIPWYEPADRAKELLVQFPDFTFSHLEYESHAWPGGYEISYIVKDGGVLCHQCANRELERTLDPDDDQFHVVGEFTNDEDSDLYCDHCGRRIEPAYGED